MDNVTEVVGLALKDPLPVSDRVGLAHALKLLDGLTLTELVLLLLCVCVTVAHKVLLEQRL